MQLTDYNIMSVHIKGTNNVLVDAISWLKTLNIYKEPLENQKMSVVSDMQENGIEICATDMHTISINMLYTEQKWGKMCRKLVSQICHTNESSFKSVIMSASAIQHNQHYIYVLKHDVTIELYSLVPTILQKLHDCKGHKESFIHLRQYDLIGCPNCNRILKNT